MGKKAQRKSVVRPDADHDVPDVGARQPCPCGSGRRYKACHGRAAGGASPYVSRPFAGLPGEGDWIALREIVPAATAPIKLTDEYGGGTATVATVLPLAWPALVRQDGSIFIGLQVPGGSGDISRDVADALLRALDTEPGNPVPTAGLPGPGPRLQDVLDLSPPFEPTVHDGFDFWLEGTGEPSADVTASLERANTAVVPTTRLTSVEAAYWCQMRDRNHLRWVLPYDEEQLLDAMARLHVEGTDGMGKDSRYVGSFRAHGRLVPVWDLVPGTSAESLEEPAAAYAERLAGAVADGAPLSTAQRSARSGLLTRQVTLR